MNGLKGMIMNKGFIIPRHNNRSFDSVFTLIFRQSPYYIGQSSCFCNWETFCTYMKHLHFLFAILFKTMPPRGGRVISAEKGCPIHFLFSVFIGACSIPEP